MQARETEAAVKNTHHDTAGKKSSNALQTTTEHNHRTSLNPVGINKGK